MPTTTVTYTPLVDGGSVGTVTIKFNRKLSANTVITNQPDESVRVEPMSPPEQIEHITMVTELRNLERHYLARRAAEYHAEIDRLFPLNRIEETFRRNVNEYYFAGDERCVLGPTLERSSDGTLIIPKARSAAGVPVSAPFTIQSSINERTFRSVIDEHVTTLGGVLLSYCGNSQGSVANDNEHGNDERAAERALARDRSQYELNDVNTRNRRETLDSGREDCSAAPPSTTESNTHPRIPGWENKVMINRPAHHSADGELQMERILRSSIVVHHHTLNWICRSFT